MAKSKKSGSILLQLGGAALAGYGIYLLFGRDKSTKETLIERERVIAGGNGLFAGAYSGLGYYPSAFGGAAVPLSYKQGCTDPNFQEYDSTAIDVCPPDVYAMGDCFGSTEDAFKKQLCLTPLGQGEVLGCTDQKATNYNPQATKDDGSCQYDEDLFGCIDPNAENFDPLATEDDGSCFYEQVVFGCTDPTATNYNPDATQDDGNCEFATPVNTGCTDPAASNYNPNATQDDGSCFYLPAPVVGCTDPAASNYNPNATQDDGSCAFLPPPLPPENPILGCTCPEAPNYNPDATVNNLNCKVCTNPAADNYSTCPTNAPDYGSCIIGGCTDPNASNYNPEATYNNNTCSYPTGGGGGALKGLMPTLGGKSQMPAQRQMYSSTPTASARTSTARSTTTKSTRSFDGKSNEKMRGYYDALDARRRVNEGTFA